MKLKPTVKIFYECNFCKHMGIVVTSLDFEYCGGKGCGKRMLIKNVQITEEAYRKVWG